MAHLIPIPTFDGNGFEAYERDVSVWRNATDVPKEKQALVLILRLTGLPAALAKAEPLTAYTKDAGVGNLLNFLRKKFGVTDLSDPPGFTVVFQHSPDGILRDVL